ncbi:MAG: hypothetical protein HY319_16010 [Armatimonadetes bacterium]|nr:hypothetical protein [Armatimonadota bacterium]
MVLDVVLCPYCDRPLDPPEADRCAACGQSLVPREPQRYKLPLEELSRTLEEVSSQQLPAYVLPELFSNLMGVVQHTLDSAREDLEANFRKLRTAPLEDVPEEARVGVLEFIRSFGDIQNDMNATIGQLRDLFLRCETSHDVAARQPAIELLLVTMKHHVERLNVLEAMTSHHELTVLPDEPLPEDIVASLRCFDRAMGAIDRYCDTREREAVEECVRFLDEARGRLARLLMVEAFEEGPAV